ncbi:protein O-glucosyltransferase 2-like [Venturia canescens]|uniref:protein O-glucosyltransferase 2-like n=1 Tax=Venturia canescens TaxID=32260 RepID=UPI001C9C2521|nr:protein O-glucosyltransferase 2-like [Venturia canescens]
MTTIAFVLLVLSYCCKIHASMGNNAEVDPTRTLLWGPGLNAEKITMRARYFFLQLYDSSGKNLTRSPGDNVVSVQIKGQTEHNHACHIWTQVLDCNDGSFIIRYKIHNTCYDLRINVKVKNQDINLPKPVFRGPVFEEDCYCPSPVLETWLKDYECSQNYQQIDNDLKLFPKVDFGKIRNELIEEYNKPNSVSICHYVVKNNKIYRKCYGQHVGFKIFMDSTLLSLARKVVLPDVEFFMNLGDWPLVPNKKKLYPIFSWCGSNETRDIVLPTYDITESSIENMGRVMLDMLSVQGNTKTPWEKKIQKLFWRGRDSRRERLDLIDISRKHPDLFNTSITNFFFFKDEIEKYGPGVPHVSFFKFFQFKYQLSIDGTVAAYRFPYLLAGDSLVMKQDSKYYEYFYNQIAAGEHYIAVKQDLSDLVEKILWAQENDEEAEKIAKAGRNAMRDLALPRDVFCYHVTLLREWRKRLSTEVRVLDGMEEVPQSDYSCKCHRMLKTEFTKSKEDL